MTDVQVLANQIIEAGIVPEVQAVIGMIKAAEHVTAPNGRTVDPDTGEVVTRVTTSRGQLPEALLDSFRQYYGAGDKHQWGIGKVVDDALIEFAGKYSANKIIKAAAKEMDLSRAGVLKCQTTWRATDASLRAEFDMLKFEHFAVVVRYLDDRAAMWQWLAMVVDSGAEYGGRFMPAKKLEAKLKQHLGVSEPEPTFAELVARALTAAEKVREHAPDERKLTVATQVCAWLEKLA